MKKKERSARSDPHLRFSRLQSRCAAVPLERATGFMPLEQAAQQLSPRPGAGHPFARKLVSPTTSFAGAREREGEKEACLSLVFFFLFFFLFESPS